MSVNESEIFLNDSGPAFFQHPDTSLTSLGGDPSTMLYTSFNNGATYMLDDDNMMEYDLETLLNVNNVPTYSPINASTELSITPSKLEEMLNNSLIQEPNHFESPQVEVKNELNISSGQLFIESVEGSGWVQGQDVEMPSQSQDKNYLLIKIPEELQDSSSFETLPSVHLKPNLIRDINKASAGHDGVYLKMPENLSGPATKKHTVNIIRRKPLQIIQTVVPALKMESKVEEVKVNKRKQQFTFTREDSVMFLGDSPETQEKRPRFDADDWFATFTASTAASDGEKKKKEKAPVDESNRCQGCKKIFKNVANHKCKKLASEGSTPRKEKEAMICAVCSKKYKSKKGMLNHFKKCDQSSVFENKSENNSENVLDIDDANEIFPKASADKVFLDEAEGVWKEVEDVPEEAEDIKHEIVTPKKPLVVDIISVEIIAQADVVVKMEENSETAAGQEDEPMSMEIGDITVKQEKCVMSSAEDSVMPPVEGWVMMPAEAERAQVGLKITKRVIKRRKKTAAKRSKKRKLEMKKQKNEVPSSSEAPSPASASPGVKKAAPKRLKVHKPATRLSTKQVKMLTRSATKKTV